MKAFALARQSAGVSRISDGCTEDILSHASSFIPDKDDQFPVILWTWNEDASMRRRKRGISSPIDLPNAEVIRIAFALIRCLGFPEDVSLQEMVSYGFAFVCARCNEMSERRWDWRHLVS